MKLPLKTVTDEWWSDKDVIPKPITYSTWTGIKNVTLYGDTSGVLNKFSVEEYPTQRPAAVNKLWTFNHLRGR